MEFKRFLKYYELFRAEKMNALLSYKVDTELTYVEKELFSIRLLIRGEEWDKAISKLEALKTENPFLKGERYFLIASIFLIKSDYEESAKFGNLAVRYYEEISHKEGLFKSYYNLSVAFNRIGMDSLSDFYLIQAGKNVETIRQKFIMDRADACRFSKLCDYPKAVKILDEMFEDTSEEIKFEVEAFKTVAADIYFRAGELEKAKKVIRSIMDSKSHPERGRTLFYYHMISILEDEKRVPSKPHSVSLIPEFSLKWDLIVAIVEGDTELISHLWKKVTQEFPKYFSDDFRCLDKSEEKAIFNTVLQKLLLQKPEATVDLNNIKGKKSRKLLEILLNSQTPIRKEVLIEMIWDVE